MWAEERRRRILETLQQERRAEAEALAIMLDVSRETIRRDLMALEKAGHIQRTHGGALISGLVSEEPFMARLGQNIAEKQAIAAAAVKEIQPGQSCFVDAGSTTLAFAEALAELENISIITNSIEVALAIHMRQASAEILLLGGLLSRDVPGTFGGITQKQLADLRADVAFVSPVGVHAEAGVSYFDLSEADIARSMLEQARRRVILADSSKCGLVSRTIVAPCSHVDVLVTGFPNVTDFERGGIDKVVRV